MKTKQKIQTYIPKAKAEIVSMRKEAKTLSLDEIESQMIQLATDDSGDILTTMINEKKLSMLEKVATLKIRRLQIKELEREKVIETVEPLTIEFVNSDTEQEKERLERIDNEIINSHQAKQDA